jgi:hypothetical protein
VECYRKAVVQGYKTQLKYMRWLLIDEGIILYDAEMTRERFFDYKAEAGF